MKKYPNKIWFLIGAREKVINGIRSRIFPIKDKNLTPESERAPETAPEPLKSLFLIENKKVEDLLWT